MGEDGGVCRPCHLHAFLSSYWDSREGEDFDEKVDELWNAVYSNWKKADEEKKGQQDPAEFFMEMYYQILEDVPKPL